MAKQDGIFPLRGSIGEVTFTRTKNGYFARRKGKPITREQLHSELRYRPTLNSTKDFGTAAKASALLRASTAGVLKLCANKQLNSKLTGCFRQILKTDTLNPPGERKVGDSDISLLKKFSFNQEVSFERVIGELCSVNIDLKSGQAVLAIPSFTDDHLQSNPGTSHFIIHSIALTVNFENKTVEESCYQSGPLLTSKGAPEGLEIMHSFPPETNDCLIILAGIRFYDETNDLLYAFSDKHYNTVSVVYAKNMKL